MLLRRRVVRFCARVAAVPAVVRTLTSRITVRDAVEATAAKEDVSVLVSPPFSPYIIPYFPGYNLSCRGG